MHSSYNDITGRPALMALKVVTSIHHLKMKFSTDFGVGEVCRDQKIFRQCYVHTLFSSEDKNKEDTTKLSARKESMNIEIQSFKEGLTKIVVESVEKTQEIELVVGDKEKKVSDRHRTRQHTPHSLNFFTPRLCRRVHLVSRRYVKHQRISCRANLEHKPVRQKKRTFAPERQVLINEEVDKLLKSDFIFEIHYLEWLANIVMVKKTKGKW